MTPSKIFHLSGQMQNTGGHPFYASTHGLILGPETHPRVLIRNNTCLLFQLTSYLAPLLLLI